MSAKINLKTDWRMTIQWHCLKDNGTGTVIHMKNRLGSQLELHEILKLDKNTELPQFLQKCHEDNIKRAKETAVNKGVTETQLPSEQQKRRVYIVISWLPTSKSSSHVRSLLNLVEIYQKNGIHCTFIITGMEFTHHRGMAFYLSKTNDELHHTFQNICSAINRPDYNLLRFKFLVSSKSANLKLGTLRNELDTFFIDENITSNDLIFCVTGMLSCRYSHSFLAGLGYNVVAFAHNAKDNIGILSTYAKSVIMPSLRSPELLDNLIKLGFERNHIHENVAPTKPFDWQKTEETNLGRKERSIIQTLKSTATTVFITANARFNSIDEPKLFELINLFSTQYPDMRFVHIMVGFDEEKPSAYDISHNNRIIPLAWTEDLYGFIREVKKFSKAVYCYPDRSDSGGSNRLAHIAGVPVVLFENNDAVSAIPAESVVKSYPEFYLKIARYVLDDEYYFGRECRISEHEKKLSIKASELFMSLFNN